MTARLTCAAVVLVVLLAVSAYASTYSYELTGNYGGKMYVDVDYLGSFTATFGARETVDRYNIYFRGGGTGVPSSWLSAVDIAITGDLFQIWKDASYDAEFDIYNGTVSADGTSANLPSPTLPTTGGSFRRFDSHFMQNVDVRTDKTAPKEDISSGAIYTENGFTQYQGYGTFLGGVYGITTAAQTNSLLVAQLDLARNTTATFASGTYSMQYSSYDPLLDEFGNPVYDEYGDPVYVNTLHTSTVTAAGQVSDASGETFNVSGYGIAPTPQPPDADVLQWTGLAGNDWSNASSWDPHVAPAADKDLRIVSGTPQASAVNIADGGKIRVSGSSTQLTLTGELQAAASGQGTLTIDSGGRINSESGSVGYDAGSAGTVNVTGENSRWTNGDGIYVGQFGSGAMNISAGGQVCSSSGYLGFGMGSTGTVRVSGAGSSWESSGLLEVGHAGSGSLVVEDGGYVSSGLGHLGEVSSGAATITGFDSCWAVADSLTVGGSGTGSLTIKAGGKVTDVTAYVSHAFGFGSATGTVTVTGAGSRWDSSGDLKIAVNVTPWRWQSIPGTVGVIEVTDGGHVTSSNGYIGFGNDDDDIRYPARGTATVTGSGSEWTNTGSLYVGRYIGAVGTLNVSNGGKVAAFGLLINPGSAVRLLVSGNDMIVLGSSSASGNLTNTHGQVKLYATPFLGAGTYTPISAYPEQTWTYSGSAPGAFGGQWNSSEKTFTVPAATPLVAGSAASLAAGQRLLITDGGSGKRMGVSVDGVAAGKTLMAAVMSAASKNSLLATPGFDGTVLSAWSFSTNLNGTEALLSFDIGLGTEDVKVWRYSGGAWSLYDADMLTYDSQGIVSFVTSDFSGYAITAIPEPATLSLLALGSLAIIRRWRV